MDNSHDQRAALGWHAYLYTSEQMSATEREAFEERLDGDQLAREMVAQVVQLTHTLHALPVEAFEPPLGAAQGEQLVLLASFNTSSSRRVAMRSAAGWMAMGASACWMLLMLWGAVERRGGGSLATSSSRPVVLAWTEYAGQPGDAADDPAVDSADDRAVPPTEPAGDSDPDLAAPDWLVSAMGGVDEADVASPEAPPSESDLPLNATGSNSIPTDGFQSTDKPKSGGVPEPAVEK